ncbi:NfeD family protein [Amycolatopsis sp. SID8362]|uniref:NfeD family protein n=1 Tax=Amycolatopsis sp. SID8362 TaxID=2690346 RepID=UPI001367B013|nr:NfeD family protein [Amycolatopsis sp. SID8362]NBH09848.1 NfeD family protein [Amycolatopsis sp. SID8362]NED46541.1 NfeD family protein [Amycolatopsis sp. SID8362]
MSWALVWLIVGIALMIAEVVSGDFVLIMLGVAALFGAGAEVLTGNLFIDVAVFAVASVGMLVLVRPALKRRFLTGPTHHTGIEALIGARAVVVSTVDHEAGRVKLAGDVWSARSMSEHLPPIQPGTSVTVVEISGATAVVATEP